jgi:hypothetical protein
MMEHQLFQQLAGFSYRKMLKMIVDLAYERKPHN